MAKWSVISYFTIETHGDIDASYDNHSSIENTSPSFKIPWTSHVFLQWQYQCDSFECEDCSAEEQGQSSPTAESRPRVDWRQRVSEDVIENYDNTWHLQDISN